MGIGKSQFSILLEAITDVSTQVDDLRVEMRRDFATKKELKAARLGLRKEFREDLEKMKNEIVDEVISAVQPSIAALEDTGERHDKALKVAGLLC